MNGYIKIHRRIKEWQHYQDPVLKHMFIDLLLDAAPFPVWHQGVRLMKGEVATSVRMLCESTRLSRPTVIASLRKLEQTGEIKRRRSKIFTIITIVNYAKYQYNESEIGQNDLPQNGESGQNALPIGGEGGKNILPHNKNIYNNIEVDVVARTRTRAFSTLSVENLCVSLGVDKATYLTLAEQVFAEWEVTQSGDRDMKHFISTMRIKVDAWRRQQQNQQRETPLERRQRAEREAMMAAAAAISQTLNNNNHTK